MKGKIKILAVLMMVSGIISAQEMIGFSSISKKGIEINYQLKQRMSLGKNSSHCSISTKAVFESNGQNVICISNKRLDLSGFIAAMTNMGKCNIDDTDKAKSFIQDIDLICDDPYYIIESGRLYKDVENEKIEI